MNQTLTSAYTSPSFSRFTCELATPSTASMGLETTSVSCKERTYMATLFSQRGCLSLIGSQCSWSCIYYLPLGDVSNYRTRRLSCWSIYSFGQKKLYCLRFCLIKYFGMFVNKTSLSIRYACMYICTMTKVSPMLIMYKLFVAHASRLPLCLTNSTVLWLIYTSYVCIDSTAITNPHVSS